MSPRVRNPKASGDGIAKAPTGVTGLDEITGGGLPKGRPTLVCGGAGCGKTLLAIEFLVRGATRFHEPGVFVAFEETEEELTKNVASLGFDLAALVRQRKIALDHVYIERSEIEETGQFDLEGLFVRLGHAIASIGAKRVVLDTIEALFASLPNEAILRAELRRLFRWLKEKGVTAMITGERGEGTLTRYGLEEYVADCVILLDHRIVDQISTRRLRVIKYRGSFHGTNEYPFLIEANGISVLPITSLGLKHPAPTERVATGVADLDAMLGAKGYFRGSNVLVSGAAGTGKSSLAAAFVEAACKRGERAVYFAFEESPEQILRNMGSIGIHLAPWVSRGLLRFHAVRPSIYGLEMHLLSMHQVIAETKPSVVAIDPVSNLISIGERPDVRSMLTRLIDFLKTERITSLFTSLTENDTPDISQAAVSSLMDTWVLVRNVEQNGERRRALYLLKSRGMAHSNRVREFSLSSKGIKLIDSRSDEGSFMVAEAQEPPETAAAGKAAAGNGQRGATRSRAVKRAKSR